MDKEYFAREVDDLITDEYQAKGLPPFNAAPSGHKASGLLPQKEKINLQDYPNLQNIFLGLDGKNEEKRFSINPSNLLKQGEKTFPNPFALPADQQKSLFKPFDQKAVEPKMPTFSGPAPFDIPKTHQADESPPVVKEVVQEQS